MSSETSSRSTGSPSFSTSALLKAVDWTLNGGAVLLNELTMRTRLGTAADAVLMTSNGIAAIMAITKRNRARSQRRISHEMKLARRRKTPVINELNTRFRGTGLPAQRHHFTGRGF